MILTRFFNSITTDSHARDSMFSLWQQSRHVGFAFCLGGTVDARTLSGYRECWSDAFLSKTPGRRVLPQGLSLPPHFSITVSLAQPHSSWSDPRTTRFHRVSLLISNWEEEEGQWRSWLRVSDCCSLHSQGRGRLTGPVCFGGLCQSSRTRGGQAFPGSCV